MSVQPPEEQPKRLLIVHDDERILSTLIAIFQNVYTVVFCSNSNDAGPLIRQGFRPNVIIAPLRYAGLVGNTFIRDAKSYIPELVCLFTVDAKAMAEISTQPQNEEVYMLLNMSWPTPEIMQAVRLAFQHYRYSHHNARLQETKEREETVLAKIRQETGLSELRIAEQTEDLAQNHVQIVTVLGRIFGAVERAHHNNHALYTAFVAQRIAASLGLPKQQVTEIMTAALLHDVGKLGLPFLVTGPDPVTLPAADREMYETHAAAGARVLARTGLPPKIAEIVRQHHERLDGSGFPAHISGEALLVEAQIVAVADAFHNGVYRVRKLPKSPDEPLPVQTAEERDARIEETFEEMRRHEAHYEPRILHSLYAVSEQIDEAAFREFTLTLGSTDWSDLFPELKKAREGKKAQPLWR